MTLYDEDGVMLRCFECDRPAHHRHHVIPSCRRGTKTVPLCMRCHGRVHDHKGWRTDTLSALQRQPFADDAEAKWSPRHRQVMSAFDEWPDRIENPPTLVKTVYPGRGYKQDLWIKWLRNSTKAVERRNERLRKVMRG